MWTNSSPTNDFGAYIGRELVEMTRRMLPLSHKREGTFLSGFSMGGFGAIRTVLKYHDTFGYIIGCRWDRPWPASTVEM